MTTRTDSSPWLYVDDANGDLYLHQGGEWVLKGNIRGGGGGGSGNVILFGSVDPTTLHSDGDMYVNQASWHVFHQESSAWVDKGSIRGADGAAGADGADGATGPKGDTGDQGIQGIQGIKGDTGDQGPAGNDGAPGATGATGAKGDQGDPGATGATGPKGDKGDTGATGSTGPAGTRGSQFYVAAGAPGTIGGQANGDDYLNSTNGDVYSLISGTWTLQGNIRGPTGATGSTGSTGATGSAGADGARGSVWRTGSGAPSVIAGDANGDFYVRSSNGEVYKMVAGSWADQGFSIQGPTGATGSAGTPAPTGKGFSVHRNGVDQTGVASSVTTKVLFTTAVYNDGTLFDLTNSRWTPPAGKIMLTGACWSKGTFLSTNSATFQIYKNGSAFRGGFTYSTDTTAGTSFVTLLDVASGTDYYEAFVSNATTGGAYSFSGSTLWTWFTGVSLP